MTPDTPATNQLAAAVTIVAVFFSIYLLVVGEAIFIPLVLAIFITYLVVALAHALQRLHLGRFRLPRGLALTAATILFLLGIAILVQMIAGNAREVVETAPAYQARLQEVLAEINIFVAENFTGGHPLTVTSVLQQIDLRAITARLASIFQAFASNTFQILVYVAFLLLEVGTFDRKMNAMFPNEARQNHVRATLLEIGHKIERYVLVKTLVSFITGCCSLIVLSAIGLDFAPFWALLHFVLNFVPYVGALVAITLPSLFALLKFGSIAIALLAGGILTCNQLLIDNVLEPRLAGRTLNLSPIAIILGLSVWGTMWGVIGMILSVPIMVVVMIVLSQFPRTRPVAILMSERGEIR